MSEMFHIEHRVFNGNNSATCILVVGKINVAEKRLVSTMR
jgi:hypothetical protein